MTVDNNDKLKVVWEATLDDGSIIQNVYYLIAQFLVGQAEGTILTYVEQWIEDAYNDLSAELLTSMTQNICTISEVTWNAADELWEVARLIGYFTPTITFNNATDGLPNQTSAVPVFPTGRPKTRGRKFLPPFGEDRQSDGILISASLAATADYAGEILNGITIGPGNELVSGVIREGVNEFAVFAVAVVSDILGTQRRRKPGVGA